jgi:hypothetical protein
MNLFKKKIFTPEISNVLYLLDKLQHDKGNFNLRLELAENLENLDNISDALYHLIIAHELDSNNQNVISKIVKNLININDLFEAKKWSLKLDKENELLNSSELLDDQFEINKLIFFGTKFLKYSYCFNINSESDLNNSLSKKTIKKIEDSKIIYIEKNCILLFKQFYKNYYNNLKNIDYIFTDIEDINDTIKNEFSETNYSIDDVNKMMATFIKSLINENLKLYSRTNFNDRN